MMATYNKNFAFDEYMEPTVVDPALSAIKPIKSNFVRPSDWLKDETSELTHVEVQKTVSVVKKPTPWELFVVMIQKVLHRMQENLKT